MGRRRFAMFLLRRPRPHDIERFLREGRALPVSYGPVGVLREPARDAPIDEAAATIGRGPAAFARAVDALRAWKQVEIGWVELHPRGAPVDPGTDVAVLIRHFGFWSLNGCRVVYHVGEVSGPCFGYAYATLPTHAAAGEELFAVRIDPATADVTYTIRAMARARSPLARAGYPLAQALRTAFRRDSIAAMRRAIA